MIDALVRILRLADGEVQKAIINECVAVEDRGFGPEVGLPSVPTTAALKFDIVAADSLDERFVTLTAVTLKTPDKSVVALAAVTLASENATTVDAILKKFMTNTSVIQGSIAQSIAPLQAKSKDTVRIAFRARMILSMIGVCPRDTNKPGEFGPAGMIGDSCRDLTAGLLDWVAQHLPSLRPATRQLPCMSQNPPALRPDLARAAIPDTARPGQPRIRDGLGSAVPRRWSTANAS